MSLRAYFLFCAVAAVVVLSSIAAVNYFVDVSGVYFNRSSAYRNYVRTYVRRLVASKYGLRATEFERAMKMELGKTVPAACYVLGSSHEMSIAIDRMPMLTDECGSLINLGVSGAGFEDMVSLLAEVTQHAPAIAIVGLGTWTFKLNADTRWTEYSDAYYQARQYFGLPSSSQRLHTEPLLNLINEKYFWRNIEVVFARGAKIAVLRKLPAVVELNEHATNLAEDDAVYRPDGSLTYSKRYRNSVQIRDVPDCNDYKLREPFVDPSIVKELEHVVHRAHEMGIKIKFLLMPYHPGIWLCPGRTPAALREVEPIIRDLAERSRVEVIGSYDARQLGLTPKDFDDFMHIDALSLIKITR